MTPLHIQIMLHYYCNVTPYAEKEPAHRNSSAVMSYTDYLVDDNMLRPSQCEGVYVVTEKGRAYIDALKAVAEPIAKTIWVQP